MFVSIIHAEDINQLLNELDKSLLLRDKYIEEKAKRINSQKLELLLPHTPEEEYLALKTISEDYRLFICDSAQHYSDRALELAERTDNKQWIIETKLNRVFLLCYTRLFKEAFDLIATIDKNSLDESQLPRYYRVWMNLYYYQALDIKNIHYRNKYYKEAYEYIDLYLLVEQPGTTAYLQALAFRYYEQGNIIEAEKIQMSLINDPNSPLSLKARNMHLLGSMYMAFGEEYYTKAEVLHIKSAIICNELAIVQYSPLLSLADLLLKQGKSELAYNYIEIALENAAVFNDELQRNLVGRTHSLLQDIYIERIEQQQSFLLSTLLVIVILLLVIVFFSLYLMKRNRTLMYLKRQLIDSNKHMEEANSIKEIYITHALNMSSYYVNEMIAYKKEVNRKINMGLVSDLTTSNTDNVLQFRSDLDEFYRDFDNGFLTLYPDFVDKVNLLLQEDKRYELKYKGNVKSMNAELRMLALIRLGITDNKQIASFLNFNIQTIYNYRNKAKLRALNIEGFEDAIRQV